MLSARESRESAKAIWNFVSGVDLLHKLLGFHPPSGNCDTQLMLKAVSRIIGERSRVKAPLSVDMLLDICVQCDALGALGAVWKGVFLFGFFGFLRASNLLAARATVMYMPVHSIYCKFTQTSIYAYSFHFPISFQLSWDLCTSWLINALQNSKSCLFSSLWFLFPPFLACY